MPRLAPSSSSRRRKAGAGAALPRAASGAHAPAGATSGVAAALRALNVRPSRRLGQNFLTDPRVAERIVSLVGGPREPVLEIGPGLGSLTALLVKSGRELVAVELDLRLAEAVERALVPFPNARVVRGDILAQRMGTLLPGGATVVGNLPYSITTPIVEWMLAQAPRIHRAILMVQREYAQRLAARPGGKDFGSLSVFVGLHAEVATLFKVSPGAFYPRPEVDSVVLELKPRPYPGTTGDERATAERLARAGMGTRRKTIANSLARGLGLEAGEARALLESAEIDPGRRGETLGIDEWLALARGWAADSSGGSVR